MSNNHLEQDILRQRTRAGFEGADPPTGLRIDLPSEGSVEARLNVLEHLVIALGNELIKVAGKSETRVPARWPNACSLGRLP